MPRLSRFYPAGYAEDYPDGLVYFLSAGEAGPIKIGFTRQRDLGIRITQLQVGCPETLKLMGMLKQVWPQTERAIHAFLQPHCLRGEWFLRAPALALFERLSLQWTSSYYRSAFIDRLSVVTPQAPQHEEEAEEPTLEVTVLQALLFETIDTLHTVNTAQPLPFTAYLLAQLTRIGGIHDLAEFARDDTAFPLVGSLEEYLHYIFPAAGNYSAIPRLLEAWVECDNAILRLLDEPGSEPLPCVICGKNPA